MYYFLENTELYFQPKAVIDRPYNKWNVSIQVDVMSKKLYLLIRSKERGYFIESYKSKYQQVEAVSFLCDEEKCIYYTNKNFYADDYHFSAYGSKYIANKFSRVIFND